MTKTLQAAATPETRIEREEADLVERARQDPWAYAELYDRYLKPVYRYFFLRLGNRQEAEDLTSQVFLAALESLPDYRQDHHFRAWLFGIARRKLVDDYRQRRPQVALEEIGELPDPKETLQAQLVHSEDLSQLAAAFATLKDGERELLSLRFAAKLSFGEMARLLRRKESAVKMSLYRLLERLEHQMEAQNDG